MAWVRRQLGTSLSEQRRYAAAEAHLKGRLQVLADQRGASSEHATEALRRLIDLYEAWGKPDSASTYRQRLPPQGPPSDRSPTGPGTS